jgi:hypothetical protein
MMGKLYLDRLCLSAIDCPHARARAADPGRTHTPVREPVPASDQIVAAPQDRRGDRRVLAVDARSQFADDGRRYRLAHPIRQPMRWP